MLSSRALACHDTAAMNSLDLVLVCLAALAAWRGWSRGMLHQLCSWGGLLLGLVAGTILAPRIAQLFGHSPVEVVVAVATVIAGTVLGGVVGHVAGSRVRSVARVTPLRPIDHLGGAVVSVVAAGFLVWIIAFNLVTGPFAPLATEIQDSRVIRALHASFPEPPSILAQMRGVLDDAGFPQVFAGVPPEPSGPVTDPTDQQAGLAFAAGDDATVRVTTEACGAAHQGSGFVAGDDLVVVSAHVIAGGERVRVVTRSGQTMPGVPVAMDPDMDIAVLRVDGLSIEPLPLADQPAERGSVGAITGYPDGGAFTGTKAAVRHTLEASGRDIYGDATVIRPILELQTEIHPGNSGGPYITDAGEVAGVVFAASTTDPGIGYALSAETVRSTLATVDPSAGSVTTGPCVS